MWHVHVVPHAIKQTGIDDDVVGARSLLVNCTLRNGQNYMIELIFYN